MATCLSNRYAFSLSRRIPTPVLIRAWLILLSCSLLPTAHAGNVLAPFTATYVLKRVGMSVGEVRRRLELRADGTFLFSADSRSTGIASLFLRDVVTEQSLFRLDDRGKMQPLEYQYQRLGGKRERRARLLFDWTKGMVTNQIDNDSWTMPIPHNAQDKLLYQLALMTDLQTGAKEFDYEIADGGYLKSYHFAVIRQEEINTSLGQVNTWVVERRREDRVVTLWCAPRWHYLPVRIEQNETDGDRLQLYLEQVTGIVPVR